MMIQDIEPSVMDITFKGRKICKNDKVIIIDDGDVILKKSRKFSVFTAGEISKAGFDVFTNGELEYFCNIDGKYYYIICASEKMQLEKLENVVRIENQNEFRFLKPQYLGFACITALHIAKWRRIHRFCGNCTNKMQRSLTERAQICLNCGNTVYPTISPAVIVGIVNGDKLLITRAVGADPSRPALVSGYCEIGESLEATIRREVMEEVGLKVKDIRYFASQPWSFSGSILTGFFAKLDGSDIVSFNDGELEAAVWQSRDEIKPFAQGVAITSEMIKFFKDGGNPFKDR